MVQVSKKNINNGPFTLMQAHYLTLIVILFVTVFGLGYIAFIPSNQGENQRINSNKNMRVGDLTPSILSASSVLSSGRPYLIYGTAWKEDETARLVSEAIKAGFRFVDTACQPKHYQEHLVGEGWTKAAKDIGLKREELSLQTKFTSLNGQDPKRVPYDKSASLEDQVKQSLAKSLENLRTTYLDSLVLHSPMSTHDDTMKVWREFEAFVDEGKVRKLGVSNCYDIEKFTKIYDEARIKPSVLQNRFYADSGFDVGLRRFCKEHDIRYQSFWTLTASRQALATPQIKTLAKKKELTPQTLMYAFMMSHGHTPLDGTKNQDHMAEDIDIMKRIFNGEKIFDAEELKLMSDTLGIPDE